MTTIYHGWTESEHNKAMRLERRKAAEIAPAHQVQMTEFLENIALAYIEDEPDGTAPSPIIQGGEIVEPAPYKPHTEEDMDSMPF